LNSRTNGCEASSGTSNIKRPRWCWQELKAILITPEADGLADRKDDGPVNVLARLGGLGTDSSRYSLDIVRGERRARFEHPQPTVFAPRRNGRATVPAICDEPLSG